MKHVSENYTSAENYVCDKFELTSLKDAPLKTRAQIPARVHRFSCKSNKLTSLAGGPVGVLGNYNCSENQITSLKGAPSVVGGGFYCTDNELGSLEGGPAKISGNYYCDNNNLRDLKGAPKEITKEHNFNCSDNKLTSLEGIPETIGGVVNCANNELTSLKNIHLQLKELTGSDERSINFFGNPIKSHVLGLLKIKGLKKVTLDNKKVEAIINKHLKGERDIFDCQEELEDAGYEEFAKL